MDVIAEAAREVIGNQCRTVKPKRVGHTHEKKEHVIMKLVSGYQAQVKESHKLLDSPCRRFQGRRRLIRILTDTVGFLNHHSMSINAKQKLAGRAYPRRLD